MKNIFAFLSMILFTSHVIGQIPNSSFETWTNAGSYMMPTGWDNINSMTSTASAYTCEQGSPGYMGSYYLKLTTKNISGMGIKSGIAISGQMNMTSMSPVSGFPFSSRPQSLTGNWQYMASGTDQGYVSILLTRWNSAMIKRDTVAFTTQNLLGMEMSWAAFTINLNYQSTSSPDSAIITFSASGMMPTAGSYLYVDNLAFTGNVAGIAEENAGSVNTYRIFPNPVQNIVSIESDNLIKGTKILFIDISGRIIKLQTISETTSKLMISINDLRPGTYFVKISNEMGTQIQKMAVQ